MTEDRLPGFTSRTPCREELQTKSDHIADLLTLADLAICEGGDLAKLSHVAVTAARDMALDLAYALDSIHDKKKL